MQGHAIRLLALLALAGMATPTLGANPIWQTVVITEPGKYVVTRDFGSSGTHAIHVQAHDVEIDLSGFTISASGATVVFVEQVGNVTIRNGTIAGGNPGGIEVTTESSGSHGIFLEDLKVYGWEVFGIRLDGITSFRIRRNDIDGEDAYENAIAAISVESSHPWATSGTIEWNQARSGIFVRQAANVAVLHNRLLGVTVRGAADAAIVIDEAVGGLVGWNSVNDVVNGDGIIVVSSAGLDVRNNTIASVDHYGIEVEAAGNSIVANVVSESGLDGIYVSGTGNRVEENLLTTNDGFGLHFSFDARNNTYGRNTARDNTGGGTCLGPSTTDWCDDDDPEVDPDHKNTSFGENLIPDLQ